MYTAHVHDAILHLLLSRLVVLLLQPRAIHSISGENTLLVASRQSCLNPECTAVKKAAIAVMKKRDEGGEAMMLKNRKGGDAVDKAGDDVKAALRKGDVGKYMRHTRTLLGKGVSFTVSDSR